MWESVSKLVVPILFALFLGSSAYLLKETTDQGNRITVLESQAVKPDSIFDLKQEVQKLMIDVEHLPPEWFRNEYNKHCTDEDRRMDAIENKLAQLQLQPN